MAPPTLRLALLILALAVTVLFSLITAGITGLLARHTGASHASALLRAGAAFTATATLGLSVLTLVAATL